MCLKKYPATDLHSYIKIAVDIATCIARGEYREGQKILAGLHWQEDIMFLQKQ